MNRPRRRHGETAVMMAAGFANMKRLTRRAALEGARDRRRRTFERAVCRPRRSAVARAGAARRERLYAARGDDAATGTAAAFLYRERELGTLSPGLAADLVVLERDPVTDIRAVRTVQRVMAGGVWIDRNKYKTY